LPSFIQVLALRKTTELNSTSIYYGKTNYHQSMKIQAEACNQILGFEYDPVITLGKRAGLEEIKSIQGFEVYETDRGGFATLHSPGQLVIYPVFNIRQKKISVTEFVKLLEQTTEAFLEDHGIQCVSGGDSGVFTGLGKIAFIGIRVKSGVTQHGISINIKNDLKLFESIRPCGLSTRPLDSVLNHGVDIPLSEAFQSWCERFENLY
jgi:lipoyl(octanoyl) transferase